MTQEAVARVAKVFDTVADDYDQSGVEFFGPIAERLCGLVAPVAGDHALDLGCGRGAVTLRLARAVTPDGSVRAVDVSAAMVRHTQQAAESAGLQNVRAELLDASASLPLPAGGFDVLTASLVLFFLPDPRAALAEWLRLVRPHGRVGLTTFGEQDETWREVDALFHPYLPAELLDPRTRGEDSPFASDGGVERLVGAAGGVDVRTVREPVPIRFADAAQWRAWTMGIGQRVFWGFVPEDRREQLFDAAADLLERARDAQGDIVLRQDVRYTLCTV